MDEGLLGVLVLLGTSSACRQTHRIFGQVPKGSVHAIGIFTAAECSFCLPCRNPPALFESDTFPTDRFAIEPGSLATSRDVTAFVG